MDKTYDEWLTEMLIKHGVDRPHKWEKHGEYVYTNRAIPMGHWDAQGGKWYFTQEAVDYLRQK